MRLIPVLAWVLLAAAQDKPMAKLILATGVVETRVGEGEWKTVATGGEIPSNSWLRTPAKSKCIFEYSDGTEMWLNGETEVHLETSRKIDLKSGEFFARLSETPPLFEIKADRTRIEGGGSTINLGNDDKKKLTRLVTVLGKVHASTRKNRQWMMEGYACTTNDGALNTPDPAGDVGVLTAWTNELLGLRGGKYAQELERRVESMLGSLGYFTPCPFEDALRATGGAGAPIIVKFLKKPVEEGEEHRRRLAARMLGDVATVATAGDLLALLKDADAEVRGAAGKGLKRLTGQDLPPDFAAWDEWVKKSLQKK